MRTAALIALTVALTGCGGAQSDAATRPVRPKATASTLHFRIVQAPCPGVGEKMVGGCADLVNAIVYLPAGSDAFTREHEIGHIFDAQELNGAERAHLEALLEYPAGTPWWTGDGDGFNSPGERFADIYAACQLHLDPTRRWQTAYDYIPTAARFARDCAAIQRYA